MPKTTSNDVISDDASYDDKYEADLSDIDAFFLIFRRFYICPASFLLF